MKALYTSIPLALCLIICACRTDGRETPTIATPVAQHGVLQTVGNRIVDQHGAPPQLRGISFSWSIWEGRKYYNDAVVDWLVDDFHVSLIRLSMAIEPDEGYLQQPEKQAALIRKIADRGIKRGVYVIIDWHDQDRKSTRLNSSHVKISYAVFCLKKKTY